MAPRRNGRAEIGRSSVAVAVYLVVHTGLPIRFAVVGALARHVSVEWRAASEELTSTQIDDAAIIEAARLMQPSGPIPNSEGTIGPNER